MSRPHPPVPLAGPVRAVWGDADAGDLQPLGRDDRGAALGAWVASVTGPDRVGGVWWMEQVHGARVLTARVEPDGTGGVACAGRGDALVAAVPGRALVVLTADCASIALGSPEGVFAAVHAGWRGLADGVVGTAARALRDLGATEVVGAVGPCIHAECYEFADEELDRVAAVLGDGVRGRTSEGRPALDVPAAAAAAMVGAGIRQVPGVDACTACEPGYFSHRARGDRGRQALVVWSRATIT